MSYESLVQPAFRADLCGVQAATERIGINRVPVAGYVERPFIGDGRVEADVHRSGECGQCVYFGAEKLRCGPMRFAPQSQQAEH